MRLGVLIFLEPLHRSNRHHWGYRPASCRKTDRALSEPQPRRCLSLAMPTPDEIAAILAAISVPFAAGGDLSVSRSENKRALPMTGRALSFGCLVAS